MRHENKEEIEKCLDHLRKFGNMLLSYGTLDKCSELKYKIKSDSNYSEEDTWRIIILEKQTFACQLLCNELLEWLKGFLSCHASFRYLFCDIIVSTPASSSTSIFHQILLFDNLWRRNRQAWTELVIASMTKEYKNREVLAINCVRMFPKMVDEFFRDFRHRDKVHKYFFTGLDYLTGIY